MLSSDEYESVMLANCVGLLLGSCFADCGVGDGELVCLGRERLMVEEEKACVFIRHVFGRGCCSLLLFLMSLLKKGCFCKNI